MHAISINSVRILRCFDSIIAILLLHLERIIVVVGVDEEIYDSFWRGVSDFAAASPTGLFCASTRKVGSAGDVNCACFGQVGLSRVVVRRPWLSSFSGLQKGCVPIERHGCYGQIKELCRVQNL